MADAVEVVYEVVGSISFNPSEIEYVLYQTDFYYPRNHECDPVRGWSNTPVIPYLYNQAVQLQRFPKSDEAMKLLMSKIDENCDSTDPLIIGRAHKLYMDFAREIHTMGLLQRCDLFGYVQYQKALDLGYNIDYLATLLSVLGNDTVGVQSAMRAKWSGNDIYEQVKVRRRARRGCKEWDGQIYWLTNRNRPEARRVSGCWLFGKDHINDLAEEIRDDNPTNGKVGIQATLFD